MYKEIAENAERQMLLDQSMHTSRANDNSPAFKGRFFEDRGHFVWMSQGASLEFTLHSWKYTLFGQSSFYTSLCAWQNVVQQKLRHQTLQRHQRLNFAEIFVSGIFSPSIPSFWHRLSRRGISKSDFDWYWGYWGWLTSAFSLATHIDAVFGFEAFVACCHDYFLGIRRQAAFPVSVAIPQCHCQNERRFIAKMQDM